MLAGPLGPQRPGPAQPVEEGRGAHQRRDVGCHRCFQAADRVQQVRRGHSRHPAYPAGHDHPAAEPAAAQPADQPQHLLLVPAEPGGGDREPGGVSQPNGHVEMAAKPLKLRVQHPDEGGGPGHLGAGDALERVAVGQRVRDRCRSLRALGQQHPVSGSHPLEPLLDAAVLVEHPHIQVRDVLPGGLHQVLHRLDDTRAHRAVRDREHPWPGHVPGQRPRVGLGDRGALRRPGPRSDRAGPQRKHQRLKPRMTVRDHAEEVVDLPLVPECGPQPRSQGRIASRARRAGSRPAPGRRPGRPAARKAAGPRDGRWRTTRRTCSRRLSRLVSSSQSAGTLAATTTSPAAVIGRPR